MIDPKVRYQKGLRLSHLYPRIKGECACGCGTELTGRKTKWASRDCNDRVYKEFAILKGNSGAIRKELFEKQEGFCQSCGVYDPNWHADHIHPVMLGGGACEIDNFQTLCVDCHKEKTRYQMASHHKAIS
jgi:5-methylcytosine-specific restriction endonuclease McrA